MFGGPKASHHWSRLGALGLPNRSPGVQLRGALALSFLECPGHVQDVGPGAAECSIAVRSMQHDRALRFAARRQPHAVAALFIAHTRLDVARFAWLEVCACFWAKVHTVVPALPCLQTLALHIDARRSEDEPPVPVSCPLLREVALWLCAYAPSTCFRLDVDVVVCFLDTQVVVAQLPALAVHRSIVLVGDRAQLLSRVEHIEDAYPGAR
ncbi:hypothetical protein AURDEDRAFT_175302 [Auricularia subglabra TFB-10046 SS5]|uniref:Uncharacterized protein n=1 Tax=Auricularia subglabra (strain TFB-10046 / SS5) TaxID=717982 RepID=J0D8L5_AURST|nr:hypothetical protein AURDEDRAFT_175302 [Auricularia subglabra TFB-10046 SS5]